MMTLTMTLALACHAEAKPKQKPAPAAETSVPAQAPVAMTFDGEPKPVVFAFAQPRLSDDPNEWHLVLSTKGLDAYGNLPTDHDTMQVAFVVKGEGTTKVTKADFSDAYFNVGQGASALYEAEYTMVVERWSTHEAPKASEVPGRMEVGRVSGTVTATFGGGDPPHTATVVGAFDAPLLAYPK